MIPAEARGAWHEVEARLRPYVARRVPSPDVDDVVQETFVRMHRGLATLADGERFGAWVYRIAANAIADHLRDGTTLVGTCLQVHNTAFRWTAPTGAVALGRFGGGSNQQSTAVAISLDGAVIVGAGHPSLTGAMMWTSNGSPVFLGKLARDAEGTATAVSRDGSVVVGASSDGAGNHRAFRWTQQTGIVALGDSVEGLLGSFASSVSGDGRIIVGWGRTASGDVALVWDMDHGLRRLDAALLADYQTQITGWRLTRATAISDDGQAIVGYGTNPLGQTEAWIVGLPN